VPNLKSDLFKLSLGHAGVTHGYALFSKMGHIWTIPASMHVKCEIHSFNCFEAISI